MKFEITPFKSVGVLEFGMNSSQIKATLKCVAFEMPNKTTYPEYPAEHYDSYGLAVFYDENGGAEGFEFYCGYAPLYYGGASLFSLSTDDVIALLTRFDPEPNNDDPAGLCFLKIGISLYIPLDDRKIEAILVARQGYFESYIG